MKLQRSCVIWEQPGIVTCGPRGGTGCDGEGGSCAEAAAEARVEAKEQRCTVAATVAVVPGVVHVGTDSLQQLRAEYCGR